MRTPAIRLVESGAANDVLEELLKMIDDSAKLDVPQLQAAFHPEAGGIYRVSENHS